MTGDYMTVERDGEIAILTINRPGVRNALDTNGWLELKENLAILDADDSVRVIIITGAGDKAFVAGGDIKALSERNVLDSLRGEVSHVLKGIEQLSKPVIAALNGGTFGGGCELAMACDIRIAGENVKIGQTELNVGILPGGGGTQRLARLVGVGKALELILTGEHITAQEAEKIGLVNRVVPHANLLEEAKKMAKKISSKSPVVIKLSKMAVLEGASTNFTTALLMETLCQTIVFSTDDHREGLTAFLEKRKPVYRGK